MTSSRTGQALRALRGDKRGVTAVEFGLLLPVLVSASFTGVEVAYMATISMQLSDIALSVADNASRLGQTDNSSIVPTITEADIDSVMKGAREQGKNLDMATNGRIILSSLERNSSNRQYIHWQRCSGALAVNSAFGPAGTIVTSGLGRSGAEVTAGASQAVMYVEVTYRYTPKFALGALPAMTFKQDAAFLVRDQRNLSGNNGTGVGGTTTASSCT